MLRESIASAIFSVLDVLAAVFSEGVPTFGDSERLRGGIGGGATDTEGRERVHRARWARLLCRRDE